MELKLVRKELTTRSTIGELQVDGDFECFTLEDVVRPVKIKGATAIPQGVYEIVINWSQRFQRLLPLLLNVPQFDGIRIHAGNTDADTEGCILVGRTRATDFIGVSRAAFNALFAKLQDAAAREKIFITITQEPPAGTAEAAPRAAPRAVGSVRRALTAKPAKAAKSTQAAAPPTRTARRRRD